MAADIFDQPLHFAKSYESSALGAVILSMYTLGDIESLSHFKQHQHVDEKVIPNETSTSLYRDYSSLYLELIRSLSPHYERLYALQQKKKAFGSRYKSRSLIHNEPNFFYVTPLYRMLIFLQLRHMHFRLISPVPRTV